MAEERKCGMDQLTLADFKTLHPAFEEDVAAVWDFERSIEQRCSVGGTASSSVKYQIELLRKFLAK
jgi:argininosuccinate lyase